MARRILRRSLLRRCSGKGRVSEDSLLERVTAAAEERQLFAEFTPRLSAHLAQNRCVGGGRRPRS